MTKKELEEFDSQLTKIEHYVKYPCMMPWIGRYYGEKYKKVLFVAESHYLPPESTAQLNAELWYNSKQDNLKDYELEYITTRDVLTKHHLENGIWKNPGQIMKNHKILPPPESENVFEWFSFYNFFQRPAQKEGKELFVNDLDKRKANEVFYSNLKILKPEIVIFLSSKAWICCNSKGIDDIVFDFVPHPSSRWWNRKSLKYKVEDKIPLTGREKFEKLVNKFY
jgi:hypothetical protein